MTRYSGYLGYSLWIFWLGSLYDLLCVDKNNITLLAEAAAGGVLWKKVFSEISQNSQENTCASCSFIKKETLAQVFSCEFCKISKNNFSTENLGTTASMLGTVSYSKS